ncbi:lysyl oxidase family protein [Luteolibacter marinus]|uniref:lysyl oxidase family protein n=1 Tax=Luteolibacter marinus TaxID=2776705 RepID=UPI0018679B5E|nr:lysyl oxidase family protein [Luteolibacter marinus]
MKPAITLALGLAFTLPLPAHPEATPLPKVIQGGVPLMGLTSQDPDGLVVYKLIVPPATARLNVISSSGIGNVRMYLRQGAHPTYNGAEADYESSYPGTRQRIQVIEPDPGAWYVGIQGSSGGYAGVRLQAVTKLEKGAIAPPVFLPPPGVYPGEVSCLIKSRGRGTSVYYTLDGNDPDTGSTPADKTTKVTLTGDTTFKARAYDKNGQAGPVAEADYQIRANGDVIDLVNTQSVAHLASEKGGRHLFRISAEGGERLVVVTEGGKGKSTISINHGSIPPVGKPGKDATFLRGTNSVEIPETLAGDYYIALDAASGYYGRTIIAYLATNQPDLMPWAEALQPYVSVEFFSAASCEVEEGLIGAGERRLLRYNTEVRNIGGDDLVMPPPEDNPFFEYHACHGHYHFKGFAASRLLDLGGNELRTSRKVSFCLLDNARWSSAAPTRRRFTCSNQGIQAGWSDVYDSGLPGQWIEIGDLPAGDYQLELTVNPDGILPESNVENNTVVIPVTIP